MKASKKGIIINDPVDLQLIAVRGSDGVTCEKAIRALTTSDHFNDLSNAPHFWLGDAHVSLALKISLQGIQKSSHEHFCHYKQSIHGGIHQLCSTLKTKAF